jgi:hypothetical protein
MCRGALEQQMLQARRWTSWVKRMKGQELRPAFAMMAVMHFQLSPPSVTL